MNFEMVTLVVEMLVAMAVIVTMLFVGLELRRSNIETNLANTRDQLVLLSDFKSRTNDPYLADLVCRGRKSFDPLSESEKITFGLYLEQGIHAAMAVYYHSGMDITDTQASIQSSERHLIAILDHPGARDWWQATRETSPLIDIARGRIDNILGIATAID